MNSRRIVNGTKEEKNMFPDYNNVIRLVRGRPRKKGEAVKLKRLFDSEKENFTKTKVCLYGKEETIEYLSKDLLWGTGLLWLTRFILVKCGDTRLILACTDVSFTPLQILVLYGYRFKIEVTFRALKQL